MKITHQQIADRAMKIWEQQGKPEGREQEHWFQAEAELRKESTGSQKNNKQAVRSKVS